MSRIFSLNNHKGDEHQVAYYHVQAPHDHVEWDALEDDTVGKELFICSNDFGRKAGHFTTPKTEDLLVIFQSIVTRVVTHIVQFLDDNVEDLPTILRVPALLAPLEVGRHFRRVRMLIRLKPKAFGGIKSHAPDLCATYAPSNLFLSNIDNR